MSWYSGAWPAGAWKGTSWARRRGEQAVFSQGDIAALAVTIALSGASVTVSAGTVGASEGGQQFASEQGSIASISVDRALTGSAATASAGTLGAALRPTDIVGQAITSASGTVVAGGLGKTVHMDGVEATFSIGSVQGGYAFLTGNGLTGGLTGPATYGLALPLTGLEITSGYGVVSTAQDADDTYIACSYGSVTQSWSCALTGVEATAEPGDVTPSADAYLELIGLQSDTATGDAVADAQPALVGVQIDGAQYFVGAPGGAELTGASASVVAGDVFTTGDRTYAISGESITAQDGTTGATWMVFPLGEELAAGQGEIGPREVTLSGVETICEAGDMAVPRIARAGGFAQPMLRRNYIINGKKYHGLTLEELAILLQELEDIEREDVKVKVGQNKPHVISKATWDEVKPGDEELAEMLLL